MTIGLNLPEGIQKGQPLQMPRVGGENWERFSERKNRATKKTGKRNSSDIRYLKYRRLRKWETFMKTEPFVICPRARKERD